MHTHHKKRRLLIFCLCLIVHLVLVMAQADTQGIGMVTIHQVTKNGANVREAPDANAPMVGYVPMGTTYLCLSTASNGWREILLPTGVQGYVSGKLVDFSTNLNSRTYSDPIGMVSVRSDSLRTYAAPTFGSDFMGNIFRGNSYLCVDIVDDWYCIAVNHGANGDWVVYVYRDDIQFTPTYGASAEEKGNQPTLVGIQPSPASTPPPTVPAGKRTCTYCAGSGRVSCGDCYGSKKIRCSPCLGDGYTFEWVKGDRVRVTCSRCFGSGRLECNECDLGGKVVCSYCHGKGTL